MALLEKELKILPIKKILAKNLTLPAYQRPYRWSTKSTNTLFIDTYRAFENQDTEYRLGTVILHKDAETKQYNIVDGQQRLTTLAILLYVLGDSDQNILNEKYSELSKQAIVRNHQSLAQRVKELSSADNEPKDYKDYLLNSCRMVQIVTDDEQEAFQFFDSQNTRGRELDPHDILKSYHLREMNHESDEVKLKIIQEWENMEVEILQDLFSYFLFPLTQWYRKRDGLNYSTKKIDSFKGIRANSPYNYSIYHKASQLYAEQFNESGNHELFLSSKLNQFQLTQPLIAGKRFFYYTMHYQKLLVQVRERISRFHNSEGVTLSIPMSGVGDYYIETMYEGVLLFFADRFGIESLSNTILGYLYTWSYSLRVKMYAVYQETVNKYARGEHDKMNEGLDMFARISELQAPEELTLIVLEKPGLNRKTYETIYDQLYNWNGWSKNEA